jgi:hypothetical protein
MTFFCFPSGVALKGIDGSSQTLVYDPLHLRRMLPAIIDTFPLRVFKFESKLDANNLFSTFTHRKNLYDINARVTSRSTVANWANAATCKLCHDLLRPVRTFEDWLKTHPTQWTNTTIPIRMLFEQTTYVLLSTQQRLLTSKPRCAWRQSPYFNICIMFLKTARLLLNVQWTGNVYNVCVDWLTDWLSKPTIIYTYILLNPYLLHGAGSFFRS